VVGALPTVNTALLERPPRGAPRGGARGGPPPAPKTGRWGPPPRGGPPRGPSGGPPQPEKEPILARILRDA
jgi:hypothetical protein